MVVVKIPDRNEVIEDPAEARSHLSKIGIQYEEWKASKPLNKNSTAAEILSAYSSDIDKLKISGGYTTADVIDMTPETQGIDSMLAKFNKEHWHDEDEVRFTLEGRGLFHIHPEGGDVVVVEVTKGDLLRIPRKTLHWFELCEEKRIRAIRLFQNMSGWTPYYSGSGVDARYQPVCMGPAYIKA